MKTEHTPWNMLKQTYESTDGLSTKNDLATFENIVDWMRQHPELAFTMANKVRKEHLVYNSFD